MNDQELLALIEQDRMAPLPEGPDTRWIAARIQVQLGVPAVQADQTAEAHLLVGLAVLGALVPTAWALYTDHPIMLLLWPVLLFLFTPLLMQKGAKR